ncbi:mitochondrial inner-membrane-bound regulator-domain-containing protein [Annulohypoxylon bovei var. microspora]|nr:mitochondrial inner-membrane-bound regulator-domain-containing protein [Annulohypoxylon bovei var. microspora]
MIASSVYGGSICLRCRLRLLRQYTQPRQISSLSSRIFSIQHPSLRRFATESPAPIYHSPVSGVNDEASDSKDHYQDEEHEGGKKFEGEIKKVNLLKRRLSRNRILKEDAQSLDSDMLGKPASVIIMRDGGTFRRKKRPLDSNDDEEGDLYDQFTGIEALLDSQREPPVVEEVRENIDGLRPMTETSLSEREFRKLQALLMDGFLNTQLSDYLEQNKLSIMFKSKVLSKPIAKQSWIKGITPWAPLGSRSNIPEGTDPSLHGYVTDSATPKEKFAVRIMRECWCLSIGELDTGLGETRVKMRNVEFVLLMRGTQRWMSVVGQIWLDPGEKIEVFRDKKILRFVTTKPKAAILIRELSETLKQIKSKSFSVSSIIHEPISEAVLEEVGRILNAHVRISRTTNRISVTWIELKTRAAQGLARLEDLREAVIRLLLTTFTQQPGTTTSLYVAGPDDRVAGRFVVDPVSKEKLGWKDRLGQWARYMLPLAPESSGSVAKTALKKLTLPVEPQTEVSEFDENKEFLPETRFPAHPVKWAESLRVSTRVGFGYLLHANEPSASPPPLPFLLGANHPRAFAPVTPHPLHLAKLEANNDKAAHALIRTKTTLVVHFWPDKENVLELEEEVQSKRGQKSKAKSKVKREPEPEPEHTPTPQPPVLELRLAISGSEVKGVESLRAIKQTHVTDVMLPASLVDLRLTQAQYAELEGEHAQLATWQPLADFLGPARLDLARGKLEMPPRQRFPVPRRLFNYPYYSLPPAYSKFSLDPDSLISTPYRFVGLEILRSVSMPYEGFQLTYTSVDAEREGGHRTEVNLEPGFGSKTSVAEIDTNKLHDDFLATCERFARTNTLWSGYLATRRGS